MLARFSKLLLVATLTCSLGLHWALLQSVAWVNMAVHFSRSAPLTEALVKTFDGKHPCSLCKMVAEGKRSERKQEAQPSVTKLELFFVSCRFAMYPPSLAALSASSINAATTRREAPPNPPPRQSPG